MPRQLVLLSLLLLHAAIAFTSISRHVCLLSPNAIKEQKQQGRNQNQQQQQQQYLSSTTIITALIQEIFIDTFGKFEDQRIAIISDNIQENNIPFVLMGDDCTCMYFSLTKFNPISLQEEIDKYKPNIFFVPEPLHRNSFELRYQMRTSGLDKILASTNHLIYIGCGIGPSICAGSKMQFASSVYGQNAKLSKEPQFFGLNLLGPKKSVLFSDGKSHSAVVGNSDTDEVVVVNDPDALAYVWSQTGTSHIDNFVLNCDNSRIFFSDVTPIDLDNVSEATKSTIEGVECAGEPAVDPSRMMQMLGDSEYFHNDS